MTRVVALSLALALGLLFGDSWRCVAAEVNHKTRGIELDGRGDFEGSIAAFREHTVELPEDPSGWMNYGVALMRQGTRVGAREPLVKALEVFERALTMGGNVQETRENIIVLKANMKHMFPDLECPANVCGADAARSRPDELAGDPDDDQEDDDDRSPREREEDDLREQAAWEGAAIGSAGAASGAAAASREGSRGGIAAADCGERRLRFKPSVDDLDMGLLTAGKLDRMISAFEDCGVIILENAFDEDVIERLAEDTEAHFQKYLDDMNKDPSKENTTRSGRRSQGRYEVKAPLQKPFTDSAFVAAPFTLPFLQRALGTRRIEVDTLSSVTSLASSPAQHWHRDAGALFDFDLRPLRQPAHGVVVVVPLLDASTEVGPTEMLLKSHKECRSADKKEVVLDRWTLEECPWATDVFLTSAPMGSAIFMDLRMIHRGGPNESDERRSVMYVTYVQEWWFDRVNFNDKQTKNFDHIESRDMRKMLSRRDSIEYTYELEKELRDRGVDVEALQSNYNYSKHKL